jgi:hypothetical protein
MNSIIVVSASLAAISFSPPILPFTEVSTKKVAVMLEHMAEADEITMQDVNVALQLDHIRWKYQTMRSALYEAAKNAQDGATVNAKDLGKMFDTIDAALDKQKEEDLQKMKKNKEQKDNPANREV